MATVELSRVNLDKRLVYGIILSSRKEDQVEAADGISRLMQTRRWLIRTREEAIFDMKAGDFVCLETSPL